MGRTLAVAALTVFAAGACTSVGPDYEKPEVAVPDAWHESVQGDVEAGDQHLANWWTTLQDPILDDIVKQAAGENHDVRVAFDRIREARAGLGIATGEHFPDINAGGGVSRGRSSEELLPGELGGGKTTELYDAGFDATWEIDVFGRIRRSVESADASLQASLEDYRDVLVVLFADVASVYVDVRAAEERLRYARENVERQQSTLKYVTDRFETGVAPKLDVAQAQRNLATTEAVIPDLEQLHAFAVHRLGVLVGKHPSALYPQLQLGSGTPLPGGSLAIGIPANVIRQRPDVRRAERELASQNALVGVATADLYPRFTLSGTFARVSFDDSQGMSKGGSRTWRAGPDFSWNLFDGGRVRNAIVVEESRTAQLYARYEETVLVALEDVENSIVAFNRERVRLEALGRAVAAAAEAVDLVRTLYENGVVDFQNVLDSERALLDQQDALAESKGFVAKNLISLYRSIGGGWDSAAQEDPTDDDDESAEE